MTRLRSHTPCHSLPAQAIWDQAEPTGYFFNHTWTLLHCRLPREIEPACWENWEVVMYGDSNARHQFYDIAVASSCRQLIPRTSEKWHQRLKCVNRSNNFVLRWEPHANPFFTASSTWSLVNWTTPTSLDLDRIPSQGRYLVFFNHNLHLSSSHISAFVGVMTAVRDSLTRLLDRNPDVIAVLQGPHIAWWTENTTPYRVGDNLNRFFISVQREVFAPLRHRLIYLPISDLTIASVNDNRHPPNRKQISRLLHALVCGRKR